MRKAGMIFMFFLILFPCCNRTEKDLYTMGIFQVDDAPHLNEVRKGFLRALEDNGLVDGVNIRLIIRNGMGDIPEVHRIAREFVEKKVDMIVALSTSSLQAALHATHQIPIIFSSVANPYLAGAGKSAQYHKENVTGVSSKGPIKESLVFLKEILPQAKRVGTLWTPAEINSAFYLELAREAASELGLEIVEVPITNKSEVLLAAQALVNEKIDAIYQISDNTINASFEAVGRVAEENNIPLLGGFLLSTHLGASAALGWDFFDMGYKSGLMAIQVKNGKNPGDIPFQYMDKIRLYLNLNAAKKQNIEFSEKVLNQADEIIGIEENSPQNSEVR
jgi:putative ABC transport system substrate-binding protein